MNRLAGLGVTALAIFSFFVFPGHTYLTQDTQIYVAVLENLWNPAVLGKDLLVGHSHVAFTCYDEYAIALRFLTHLPFRVILEGTQLFCRALGIWGVYLVGLKMVGSRSRALGIAAVCAAGSEVWGPAILVVEFEPSPRAFALPLVLLSLGFLCHGKIFWAAACAAVALAFHPTTAAPVWVCFAYEKQWRAAAFSLLAGSAALAVSAYFQPGMGEPAILFSSIPPALEAIQRTRASYNWIGMWWGAEWLKYLACAVVTTAAALRLRARIPSFLLTLSVLGLLSVPASYLLLDCLKWAAVPQVQPARLLLFTVLCAILLASAAAFSARRLPEAAVWFALATAPAFAAPRPHQVTHSQFEGLAEWASKNTQPDAVFLFPQSGKSLEPGLFRAQALRAVYVDWKGGGQANFLPDLGFEWSRRYRETIGPALPLATYRSLGIDYLVLPGSPYRVVKVP